MDCDWVKVEGASMRPLLRSGDLIGIEWCSPAGAAPRAGDLVLGRGADRTWLVHRMVLSGCGGTFILKGDAAYALETLGPSDVWGRVVAVRRKASGPARRLRTNLFDRTIAALSRRSCRRAVYALGLLRRLTL